MMSDKKTVRFIITRQDNPDSAPMKDYGIIFRDKTFLLFIIAGVLAAQTFMQLDLLLPVYMKEFVQNQTLFRTVP